MMLQEWQVDKSIARELAAQRELYRSWLYEHENVGVSETVRPLSTPTPSAVHGLSITLSWQQTCLVVIVLSFLCLLLGSFCLCLRAGRLNDAGKADAPSKVQPDMSAAIEVRDPPTTELEDRRVVSDVKVGTATADLEAKCLGCDALERRIEGMKVEAEEAKEGRRDGAAEADDLRRKLREAEERYAGEIRRLQQQLADAVGARPASEPVLPEGGDQVGQGMTGPGDWLTEAQPAVEGEADAPGIVKEESGSESGSESEAGTSKGEGEPQKKKRHPR